MGFSGEGKQKSPISKVLSSIIFKKKHMIPTHPHKGLKKTEKQAFWKPKCPRKEESQPLGGDERLLSIRRPPNTQKFRTHFDVPCKNKPKQWGRRIN
jgi:hypothetical protein